MSAIVLQGHVLDVLRMLPGGFVQTVVTSPPYWGLRSYGGEPTVWGGTDGCAHEWAGTEYRLDCHADDSRAGNLAGGHENQAASRLGCVQVASCAQCGAWRGHLGLEELPDCLAWVRGEPPCARCYVCHLRTVAAAVCRVLRDDGTFWCNLGDSYTSGGRTWRATDAKDGKNGRAADARPAQPPGIPPKSLVGIPWRVALALQADGWVLRSEVIWAKGVSFRPEWSGSIMPESVKDRPSRGHEQVFMFAKSPRYFYDQEAVMEPGIYAAGTRAARGSKRRSTAPGVNSRPAEYAAYSGKRNLRSVWCIGTEPLKEAHFAAWPVALVTPMIQASTSEYGACISCEAPWRRVVEKQRSFESGSGRAGNLPEGKNGAATCSDCDGGGWARDDNDTLVACASCSATGHQQLQGGGETVDVRRGPVVVTRTVGWEPGCSCDAAVQPQVVLDPFCGSGRAGVATLRLGRNFIGIDLKPEYCEMARRMLQGEAAQCKT